MRRKKKIELIEVPFTYFSGAEMDFLNFYISIPEGGPDHLKAVLKIGEGDLQAMIARGGVPSEYMPQIRSKLSHLMLDTFMVLKDKEAAKEGYDMTTIPATLREAYKLLEPTMPGKRKELTAEYQSFSSWIRSPVVSRIRDTGVDAATLGKEAGIGASPVRNLISGDRMPSLLNLIKIVQALGGKINISFDEEDEKPQWMRERKEKRKFFKYKHEYDLYYGKKKNTAKEDDIQPGRIGRPGGPSQGTDPNDDEGTF